MFSEQIAKEKIEHAILDYSLVDETLATEILKQYRQFVEVGARDTPSFVFTSGDTTDWYIAQVVRKGNNS